MEEDREAKPGELTEDKVVNIKILREYLEDLRLHPLRFKMNKFVGKQKKLEHVAKFDDAHVVHPRHSFKHKNSIFNSYKQIVLEGKQPPGKPPLKSSIYKARDSNLFSQAYHRYDTSFQGEREAEERPSRVES